MSRLRLITSRPTGYRRAGIAIGTRAAPLILSSEGLELEQVLAILQDPNIEVAVQDEEDDQRFKVMPTEIRADAIAAIETQLAQVDTDDPPPDQISSDPGKSEGEAQGAAAPDAKPEEKASESQGTKTASDAADLAGTDEASAASSEESRQQAEPEAADQKASGEEEKQPKATAEPSVAEPKSKAAPTPKVPAKKPAAKTRVAKGSGAS